ncbi:putative disease resistance protein RGA3 isoform X2 [Durio zibethinus]|uniref:Disease resistance protein RGA3 isoform X2 n=1 Tax=Durio zibethinus TaxID=66656 RepID=A0A6P5WP42_DURZI|nr:putative disease resistance protein RGA3 isoform X2 [Durio zibethinus]
MAESLVSIVLQQLLSITERQAEHELKLVTGVDGEVDKLTGNLLAIKAVLENADKRQVNDPGVKLWLGKLKDVSYDIDDVLDEWNTALLKRQIEQAEGTRVRDAPLLKKVWPSFTLSSCFCLRQVVLRHEIALKIEELNQRLAAIANERSQYNFTSEIRASHEQRTITTSVIAESEVFVREEDKKAIKDMLCEDSEETTTNLRIISVVGMGGIGKTTLTRLVFNDAEIESHFEKRIWVCVSDLFEEERIAIEILESLTGSKPNLVGRDNILQQISEFVSGKKILLVLDDVWNEDPCKWEQLKGSLKNTSRGSRILATTRKETAGNAVGSRRTDMFFLGELSAEKCWSLFCHLAFFDRATEESNKLEDFGRKFVERCRGLPLAVKTIGCLLRFKTEKQWKSILESQMWEIEEVEKDYRIRKDKLIKLWMAQGFLEETRNEGMEIIGEEYFNKLAMLSFFQDFTKNENGGIIRCKMHDIVHDFAQFLTKGECLFVEMNGVQEPWTGPAIKTIRHSMLKFETEDTSPIPIDNWKKLRSLLIESKGNFSGDSNCTEYLLIDSIDQLTCLRALDLGAHPFFPPVRIISDKIGKLIHLRYLNLSGIRYSKIPEALCELYNLQTLDIRYCRDLKELPLGIGKLINLTYLENEGTPLSFMPKGMLRLRRLLKLDVFAVRKRGVVESKSCSLEGLGKFTHLQGNLTIQFCAIGAREAAPLSAMTGLRQLTLDFDSNDAQDEAFFLQALRPPPNLESLYISRLEAPILFCNWMMPLTMLKSVKLGSFGNCESLPPMGKLPFLESLHIDNMHKVKKVGEEFLGIERAGGQITSSSSSSSLSTSSYIAFPNLKSLKFLYFGEWEEWEEWEYGNLSTTSGGQYCSCIAIMPCLQSLIFQSCPKLKALPHQLLQNTAIQVLNITSCPILKERLQSSEDWPHISCIINI